MMLPEELEKRGLVEQLKYPSLFVSSLTELVRKCAVVV